MTDSPTDVFALFAGLESIDDEHSPPGPQPYTHDLEYLHHECEWILTRCRRLRAERLASRRGTEADLGTETRWRLLRTEQRHEMQRAFARLASERLADEHHTRQEIDARHRVTLESGQPLALDRLCEQLELAPFDRLILLIAVATCIDDDVANELPKIVDRHAGLTPAMIMHFAELDRDARITHRRHVRRDAPLRRHGLLTAVHQDDDPRTFYDPDLRLTHDTFERLIGESHTSP